MSREAHVQVLREAGGAIPPADSPMHTGVATEKWPASSQRPAPGTKFELPIILVGEIREGKIIKMREYFDLLTLTEAGTPHRLYS
jgi:ketosteroid isomerase-like protein